MKPNQVRERNRHVAKQFICSTVRPSFGTPLVPGPASPSNVRNCAPTISRAVALPGGLPPCAALRHALRACAYRRPIGARPKAGGLLDLRPLPLRRSEFGCGQGQGCPWGDVSVVADQAVRRAGGLPRTHRPGIPKGGLALLLGRALIALSAYVANTRGRDGGVHPFAWCRSVVGGLHGCSLRPPGVTG